MQFSKNIKDYGIIICKSIYTSWFIMFLFTTICNNGWIDNIKYTIDAEMFKCIFLFFTGLGLIVGVWCCFTTYTETIDDTPSFCKLYRTDFQLKSDAVHEAAHIIVAEKLGLEVLSVSLEPRQDSNARIVIKEPDEGFTTKRWIEAHIQVCMAGILAEYMLLGSMNDGGKFENSDLKTIDCLINLYLLHTCENVVLTADYANQSVIKSHYDIVNLDFKDKTKVLIDENKDAILNKAEELIENYKSKSCIQ